MTSPQNNQIPMHPDLEEALLLVSGEQDESLTPSEQLRLSELEVTWGAEVQLFRTQCRQLRTSLQSIARTPVQTPLWTNPAPVGLRKAVEAMPVRRGRQTWIAGTAMLALSAMLLMMVRSPRGELKTADQMLAKSVSDSANPGLEPEFLREESRLSETVSADQSETASTLVASDSAPAVMESSESDVAEESIVPLIATENWNVVVVKVEGQDRDQVMDRIQSIVHAHGLRLQRSAGRDEPEWLGVVLTSAYGGSAEVVNAMEQGAAEHPENVLKSGRAGNRGQAVAKPDSVMDTVAKDKAEIVAAVRRSLKYPTLSELHHGRVFVALPTEAEMKVRGRVKEDEPLQHRSLSHATDGTVKDAPQKNTDGNVAAESVPSSAAEKQMPPSVVMKSRASDEGGPNERSRERADRSTAPAAGAVSKEQSPSAAVVTLVVFDFGINAEK